MGISKTKVYSFVNKVQLKAEQAIYKKYREKKEAEIDLFLEDNPVLKKAMETYDKAIRDIITIRGFIADNYDGAWLGRCDFHDTFKARVAFFGTNEFGNEKFKEIAKELDAELAKVRSEYKKIRNKCVEFRNGNKGVAYLKSLNFDVSYFDKIEEVVDNDPVDVSVLFPCGNGKAD